MSETNVMTLKGQKSKRIWMAIVLGSFAGIAPLSTDMYLPSLPLLAEDLQSTTSVAQLTLTFSLLGMALGQLFLGPLSDQKGRRKPLVISLMVYSISSVLCAFAPSVWWLIVLRFIQGVSGAGGMVISRAIVRDMYSGIELTKFFALLMLINGAAPILAPVIGGQPAIHELERGLRCTGCIRSPDGCSCFLRRWGKHLLRKTESKVA